MNKGNGTATRTIRPRKEKKASATEPPADGKLPVRLICKYAEMIDGVDLTDAQVGDRLNLSPHDAEMLIAEGWAERAPRGATTNPQLAHAADRSTSSRPDPSTSSRPDPSTNSRSPQEQSNGDKPRRRKIRR